MFMLYMVVKESGAIEIVVIAQEARTAIRPCWLLQQPARWPLPQLPLVGSLSRER